MNRGPVATVAVAALVLAFALAYNADAVELWSDEEKEQALSLDTSLKFSGVTSYAPDDRLLYPDRSSSVGLSRLRFSLGWKLGTKLNGELAYEQRARAQTSSSAGLGAGSSALPSLAEAPYRLAQLDWHLAGGGDSFEARHEIDRAVLAFHRDWGEVTVGRQAIGLGRGLLFGAVDVFSPFSPTEVDREWRRGVDALRVEYRTTFTSSVELIAVAGDSWDDSALLGRVRGYVGNVDGELIIGKRGRDAMFGAVASMVIGDAEGHGELAIFHTGEPQPQGGLFGDDRLVGKAVVGGSYTFDVGNGLTILGEYHYSGFGVERASDALRRLRDEQFQQRFLRGDTQILGQQAVGIQTTYPFNEAWTGGLLLLGSPVDGSGLVSPSIRWDAAQNATVSLTGFVPWGEEPKRGRLKSEYGATPASLFLQVNMYF